MIINPVKRGTDDFKLSYRPQTLDELLPTTSVDRLRTITTGKSSGRVFLFEGASGSGKTSTARILARALVCHVHGPCLECVPCISMESSQDFCEVNIANFRKIDDVREMIDSFPLLPTSLSKRIFILDEAQQLLDASQQVLLKALEEPPEHLAIFLCTTDIKGLKKTLIDRANLINFWPPTKKALVEYLTKIAQKESLEGKVTEKDIEAIAESCGQSVRAALNALQRLAEGDSSPLLNANEQEIPDCVPALEKALSQKDWMTACSILGREEVRRNPESTRIGLECYLRALLMKRYTKDAALTIAKSLSYISGSLHTEPKISQYNGFVLKCAKACFA